VWAVRSAVQGESTEPGTFDAFARRERAALTTFAWALTGSLAAAEELAQDALTAAWQSWDRVGGYERPGAWARRVVANRAAGFHRRAGRERRALGRLSARDEPDGPAELRLRSENTVLWDAVRALPQRQAQVVALHYLEDRPVSEIAAILDCAEATVRVHLHRGRLALARQLGLIGEER
jgi:RNA polymerase sigma-70 factor, ECF subfamily